ncbi:MAG: sulfotransferase domain-containing protein [Ardenticatenaceae bacterium]|nr:sulfotransferase domain-containing protein [Ardenticatenaceae bacterium]MCB9005489.1 sulfotransferase domain-containing protein [Ardenticatenaceae bacterium]
MLPNFLVIGAARSGTTSLYHNLSLHPQIFMPLKKEPQFFTTNWHQGLDWYARWFNARTIELAVGEASMTYTYPAYATIAPERIAQHLPDVRLIYLLRNPVERTFSHYNYYRYYSQVEKREFAEAIAEQEIYLGTSMYFEWIQRYLHYFKREKLLVVIFEDMIAHPVEELAKVFAFLEVNTAFTPLTAQTKTNATFKARNETLFTLYRCFSLSRSRMWLESLVPQKARPFLRNKIRGVLGGQAKPPALSSDMQQHLSTYFEPEIQRLEFFLGRSLNVWRSGNNDGLR